MVISWPAKITDTGGMRQQFHHVIDIAPTILEVVGIAQPDSVNGTTQKPIEGVSMAYTFDQANAEAPSARTTQYFEMFGNRAIYNDGWIACCRHGRLPWEMQAVASFADDEKNWELYHLEEDWSEANNLAADNPQKLQELKILFSVEAARYNVPPLDDRMAERFDISLRPSYFSGRDHVTLYPGMVRLPEGSAPKLNNVHHTITAKAEIPEGGAEGVVLALGGDTAGFVLMVRDGKLVYHYNWFDTDRYEVESTAPVPTGAVELAMEFTPESETPGSPATVRLTRERGIGRRGPGREAGLRPLQRRIARRRRGYDVARRQGLPGRALPVHRIDQTHRHRLPAWRIGALPGGEAATDPRARLKTADLGGRRGIVR